MKQIFMLVILFSLPVFALMSPDLMQVMSTRDANDLIPVDIVFAAQMDFNELESAVEGLPRSERRVTVARLLEEFSREHQYEVLQYLQAMENQGKVRHIRTFWINNAIYCEASQEVILALDVHEDIYYVDYDLKHMELEKPQHQSAVPDRTREIAWGVLKVRADQVWSLGYTGNGIIVGVIDTGVNYNHVDLASHMWEDPNYPNHGWNFEYNNDNPMDIVGHGTHCAGSVASDGTAGSQCGVAPEAQIMALRVRTQVDTVAENQIWAAMEFVVSPPLSPANGGDLISMSLGFWYSWNPRRSTWRTNCNNVGAAGIVMIVAAGNERQYFSPPQALRCPGDVPSPWPNPENGATGALSDVVSIGATNINDVIADFSSPGPVSWQTIDPFYDYPYPPGLTAPDVSAPGVNIKSCSYSSNTGYLDGWDGTSMATPHVAGTVALMLEKNPLLTPREIDSILQTTAVDLGATGKDNDFGAGRIDAFDAVTGTPGPDAPLVPTIVSPLDFGRLPTCTPMFRFTTTDPQADDVVYMIHWDTDTSFATAESVTTGSFPSGTVAEFTLPVTLYDGTTYWWRVKAADTTSSGMWSGLSDRRSFTIGTSLPVNTCSWFQTTGAQFTGNSFIATMIQGDSIVLDPNGYVEDTLLFENFEAGVVPAGWTVIDGNTDGYEWEVGTSGDMGSYEPPAYGSYYAFYSDDDAGSGVINTNEALVSPAIGIPGSAANLGISYGYGFQTWETGELFDVKVRFHDGSWSGWQTIATYNTDGNGTETIDLTASLPADSVQFQWMYHDEASSGHWGYACGCDNVVTSYDYTYQNDAGEVVSTPIRFAELSSTYDRQYWGDVVWHKATAGDSIGVQVEYYDTSDWQPVPDALIPNNSSGNFTTLVCDTVSLTGLTDTLTYHTLRVRGLLYRIARTPDDPSLLDWEVGNLTNYVGITEYNQPTNVSPVFRIFPSVAEKGFTFMYSRGSSQASVTLRVFDASGRLVKSFDDDPAEHTAQNIFWNGVDEMGRKVAAGVYFVCFQQGDYVQVNKAVLVR